MKTNALTAARKLLRMSEVRSNSTALDSAHALIAALETSARCAPAPVQRSCDATCRAAAAVLVALRGRPMSAPQLRALTGLTPALIGKALGLLREARLAHCAAKGDIWRACDAHLDPATSARVLHVLGDECAYSLSELAAHAGLAVVVASRYLAALAVSGHVCYGGEGRNRRYAAADVTALTRAPYRWPATVDGLVDALRITGPTNVRVLGMLLWGPADAVGAALREALAAGRVRHTTMTPPTVAAV